MKLIKKDNKKGFTLIELVVVIAILAVLALILIPSITGYVNKANTAKHEANARSIYTAAMLVNSDPTTPYAAEGDEKVTFDNAVKTIVGGDVGEYEITEVNGKFKVTILDGTKVVGVYPKE